MQSGGNFDTSDLLLLLISGSTLPERVKLRRPLDIDDLHTPVSITPLWAVTCTTHHVRWPNNGHLAELLKVP